VLVRRGEHDLAAATLVGDDQVLVALEVSTVTFSIAFEAVIEATRALSESARRSSGS
jgi:hypothetical protein